MIMNPAHETSVKYIVLEKETEHVHYKLDDGLFVMLCNRTLNEVEHWMYVNYCLEDLECYEGVPRCPECEKWSNLGILGMVDLG